MTGPLTVRQAVAYARRLAPLLHLSHWQIDGGDLLPASEDDLARINPTYGRRLAILSIRDGLTDPTLIRHTICHELLHLHLESVVNAAGRATSLLGGQAKWLADESVREAVEQTVDKLATLIAPSLPKP